MVAILHKRCLAGPPHHRYDDPMIRHPVASRSRGQLLRILLGLGVIAQVPVDALAVGFEYPTRVGLVAVLPQGICLSIDNPDLRKAAILHLIALPPVGGLGRPRILEARIDQRFDDCPGFPADVEGPRYVLKLTEGTASIGEIAFALDRPSGEWEVEDSLITRDVDADGTSEWFRVCASAAGLHLTIWTGEPKEGKRRWHRYHHLGYEVEPTCTEADVAEH